MAELTSQSNKNRHLINRRRHTLRKPKNRFWVFVRRVIYAIIILGVIGGLTGYWVFQNAYSRYSKWAEEFDLERINDLEKPSIIFDRNGEEIGRIFVENRSYVPLEKISPAMINALIAQEDARFREHPGYDLLGIVRAAKELMTNQGVANQGASSITQQLARNAYNLKERAMKRNEGSFGRKFVEIALAIRITKRYSKDQVLEFYLNRVYFGSGFYGIRAASLGYFGKEPIDLTTREAASIAALIKNPNGLSPLNKPEENIKWRNHVLSRMAKEGYISLEESDRLSQMPLGINSKPLQRGSSHIHERISNNVKEYLGEDRVNTSGLKIYTTLDKSLQNQADQALKQSLNKIESRADYKGAKISQYKHGQAKVNYLEGAAMVINNHTGAILAYIGGRDFYKRQYDIISEGARPVGTSILPFLYATAFDNGFSPVTKVLDDAIDNRIAGVGGNQGITGEWGAENFQNRYEGEITARKALAKGKVAASIRMGMEVGTKPFVKQLKYYGIRQPQREEGSTEVAPIYRPRIFVGTEPASMEEMALAYTSIPNGGRRPTEPYYLEKIEDEKGQLIWESPQSRNSRFKTTPMQQASSSATAFQVHSILQDSLQYGSAKSLLPSLGGNFNGAVQTGTQYDFADNWLFGYNSDITCGVWIGFIEGKSPIYPGAFSSETCGPVFTSIMNEAKKDFPGKEITPPISVEKIEICQTSGKRATNNCFDIDQFNRKYKRHTYQEYLRKGDSNISLCDYHGEGLMEASYIQKSGKNKILPLAPIIPTRTSLVGKDPYFAEENIRPQGKNYDLMGGDANAAQAQELPDEETSNQDNTSTIHLPEPAPIDFPLPSID